MMKITLPPTTSLFFQIILSVSSFQFFNMDDYYNKIFEFDDFNDEPQNDQFALAGYSSTNLIVNLGFLFVMMVIVVIMFMTSMLFDLLNF